MFKFHNWLFEFLSNADYLSWWQANTLIYSEEVGIWGWDLEVKKKWEKVPRQGEREEKDAVREYKIAFFIS